jgi:hypothetical protein
MAKSDHWEWYRDEVASLKEKWEHVVTYLEKEVRVPRVAVTEIDKLEDLTAKTTNKTKLCLVDAKRVQQAIENKAGTFEKPAKKSKCHSTLFLVVCLLLTALIAITVTILVLFHILH